MSRLPLGKNCFIPNFTADTYHWGCFGTSIEIYETLSERGYYINFRSVEDTHTPMNGIPQKLADFDNGEVANKFLQSNKQLGWAIRQADLVLCNGEGTMHHHNVGPWQLLYLMYFAKKYFKKKVMLVNHSSYPSGSLEPSVHADQMYSEILRHLDFVASREIYSTEVLNRLGVQATQSFDCLPRYINRHRIKRELVSDGPIIVSGGVSLTDEQAQEIGAAIKPLSKGRRVVYLTGAKNDPAGEDGKHFKLMKKKIASLELCDAKSIDEWLGMIASASLLVSARFHHTIAAASLLTPVVCMPSNSPKVDGICKMLDLDSPIRPIGDDWRQRIRDAARERIGNGDKTISKETWNMMLSLGEANFAGV